MTRKEQNQFNMMQTVSQFLTINEEHISNKSALMGAHTKLKIHIESIEANSQIQAVNTKSDAAIKTIERLNIIDTTLKVLAGMAAHGASISDTRLKMASKVRLSELKKLRDTDFVIKVRAIYQVAIPFTAELAEWGIEKSDIDSLDSSSTEYLRKSPDMRNIKAKTIQATSEIKLLFDETNTHLKTTLDPMMLPFKVLKPSFHGEYLNARAIIDLGATRSKTKPTDENPAA
jgi:hypothetical protein